MTDHILIAPPSPDLHDRYQAVCERNRELFETVEQLQKRVEELESENRQANRICAKVNEAINRAGIHCALYYWEAIDQVANERNAARMELHRKDEVIRATSIEHIRLRAGLRDALEIAEAATFVLDNHICDRCRSGIENIHVERVDELRKLLGGEL